MTLHSRLAALALVAGALAACAQTLADHPMQLTANAQAQGSGVAQQAAAATPPPPGSALAKAEQKTAEAAADDSGLGAELFYRLLVGELNARGGDSGVAYSLVLEAARETKDERLFQRAADIALQSRSGELALKAAQSWREAHPKSLDANRYLLQVLVALNRVGETAEPLQELLASTPPAQRAQVLLALPRVFLRSTDKKLAADTVERALAPSLGTAELDAAGWVAIGRMRLTAGDSDSALQAAKRAQALDAAADGPALLALDLLDAKQPEAEAIVRDRLARNEQAEVRLGYARALIQLQRYAEAVQQLRSATASDPELAQGWLLSGILLAQENQPVEAEAALKRYLSLSEDEPENQQRDAGRAQAFLALAQIAERRKDYAAAQQWLDRIPDSAQLVTAQLRRASVLAGQGKLDEARRLLQQLPQRTPEDARARLLAEVQLLRDHKQYQQAYDLLAAATTAQDKDTTELLYDQAMLAEKLGRTDEMERLLRRLIEVKPDFHHAYNALGYSLADRNVRLDEARQLIVKALSFAPDDPFINDSLGWVEFRAGNMAEAERILAAAYKTRPDADIAAHYGEVLWTLGQRDKAREIWREAVQSNADSDTLRETLDRLRVQP